MPIVEKEVMLFKNNLVKPSHAVRVRCRKGTGRIVKASTIKWVQLPAPTWGIAMVVTPTKETINRLNTSGYMMR